MRPQERELEEILVNEAIPPGKLYSPITNFPYWVMPCSVKEKLLAWHLRHSPRENGKSTFNINIETSKLRRKIVELFHDTDIGLARMEKMDTLIENTLKGLPLPREVGREEIIRFFSTRQGTIWIEEKGRIVDIDSHFVDDLLALFSQGSGERELPALLFHNILSLVASSSISTVAT